MSKHIYMTVGAKSANGLYLDRFGAATNMMNYRGVAESSDSFKTKMAAKGHIVVVSDVPLAKHSVTKQDDKDFVIDYPACFNDQMDTLFPNG